MVLEVLLKKFKKKKRLEDKVEELKKDVDKLSNEELKEVLLDLREKIYEIYYIVKKDWELKKLNNRDIEILKLLLKKGPLSAEDIAETLGISRSTASLRLNRLYSMGYLEKDIKDRRVLYFIKNYDYVKKLLEEL